MLRLITLSIRYLSFFFVAAVVAVAQSVTVHKSAPSNEDLTPNAQEMVIRLSRLEKAIWNRSLNSPGVTLSLKEVSRSRATDRTLVTYQLYATGFPNNLKYTLVEIKISGKVVQYLEGITLDEGARGICVGLQGTCRGNSPNDPIDLVVFAGKGEPKRFALISDDAAHLKAFVSVTPFPNVTTDKGCSLESVIGTPKGETTFIHGSGFEPNEDLTMKAESYGEKNSVVSKAGPDGSYFTVALPNVLGKTSGVTTWSVKGKSCNPILTFSWGTYELQ